MPNGLDDSRIGRISTCFPGLLAINVIKMLIDDDGEGHKNKFPRRYNSTLIREHKDNVDKNKQREG